MNRMKRIAFLIGLLLPVIGLGAKEGYMGVYLNNLGDAVRKAIGVESGVIIAEVIDGSPADSAGIKTGDVILAVNDEKINSVKEFNTMIFSHPNETIGLTVLRNKEEWKYKVKLGEREKKEININLSDSDEDKSGGVFGGGGGPIFLWVQPKLGEINNEITKVIGTGFNTSMWLNGGGGSGCIWENIRIGGMGGGGVQVKSGNERRAELSIGYGGFLMEYILSLGKAQFFIGTVLGGGGVELTISRVKGISWQDIWHNFSSDSVDADMYETYLECDFFHYQPYVGIQYPITPWCYLNLRGGYFGTSLGEWKEMGEPITGAPEINLSNYCASAGLIFGYFTK
ncbi:MAG: PDZ domain-containing protein [Candidatus Stahlbacteria bacterium]|nr:PDZ domain-containing protein [Candidatus Stahlbacteria bacterium]